MNTWIGMEICGCKTNQMYSETISIFVSGVSIGYDNSGNSVLSLLPIPFPNLSGIDV